MYLNPCTLTPNLFVAARYPVPPAPITQEEILQRCAFAFGVTVPDLLGKCRQFNKVQARHLAMFMLLELKGMGVVEVGHLFKRPDHTTVCYVRKKVIGFIQAGDELVNTYRHVCPELVEKWEGVKIKQRKNHLIAA